jgi:hypothetical protein
MRLARWFFALVAIGAGVAATNWLVGSAEVARLKAERDRLEHEREVLRQVVDRLTREQRVAEVIVLDQQRDEAGRVTETSIEFIELDRDGHPLPTKSFCLPGREIYFDGLVIKFSNEAVASADPLRGKSIMLFRRIFSDKLPPEHARLIDVNGDVPNVFRVDPNPSKFEQKLWKRFWEYATQPDRAAAEGIRVAQGEAVYARMSKGQRWTLTLESDGGLNLRPVPTAGAPAPASG